jgi:predicted dehydrogenase
VASGGIYQLAGRITTPDTLTACFEFHKCPVTWRHRLWGAEEYTPEISNGILFSGDRETIFVTDDRWVTIPRGKGRERKTNEARSDAGQLHMADFLEAVRTRRPPGCQPEDGYLSTAAVELAMIAYETGSKVVWDAAQEQIVGNAEASKLLKRDYRAPYRHPAG